MNNNTLYLQRLQRYRFVNIVKSYDRISTFNHMNKCIYYRDGNRHR